VDEVRFVVMRVVNFNLLQNRVRGEHQKMHEWCRPISSSLV